MKKDKLYIAHVIECIEKIEQYTSRGKEDFFVDGMKQDAVLRNLHTLAESSTRISTELKQHFPDVPWTEMAAFRNVVVHDYLGLELAQIWDIVAIDLPPLKASFRSIVQESD
ncbi:MAG: DUF86 domain-containing protein [Bacteroidota bacterium]|nr:DUF86 domain-containing protein [Bacteroidota bacterium]MDP4232904.1 DUF86 domain-containing protein [Bacteroidota bacterium]MDP4241948.1 DUF86 domain-containing protein [Bacteroidota bacterium]MDP4286851.1 DUF86 domain-containing protein [Bacteroidota bacterium]